MVCLVSDANARQGSEPRAKVNQPSAIEVEGVRKLIIEDAIPLNDITDLYELERRLGEGATATVYCGTNKETGKQHALKVFLSTLPAFAVMT